MKIQRGAPRELNMRLRRQSLIFVYVGISEKPLIIRQFSVRDHFRRMYILTDILYLIILWKDYMLGMNKVRKTHDRRGADCPTADQIYFGSSG